MFCCGNNTVSSEDNFVQVIGEFPETTPTIPAQETLLPQQTLNIKLATGHASFSTTVDDGKLVVASLMRLGGLEMYNMTAKAGDKVYRGDEIVKVNGKTKVEEMQKEVASGLALDMEVKQAPSLEVHLKRIEGVPLGLGLEQTFPEEDARFDEVYEKIYLKVKEIKSTGLVPCYNVDHPSKPVTPKHYIVEVNGERVDTTKMLNSIKNDSEWTFVFRDLAL